MKILCFVAASVAMLIGTATADTIPKGAVILFNSDCPATPKKAWTDIGSDGLYIVSAGPNRPLGKITGSNSITVKLENLPSLNVPGLFLTVAKDQIEHNPWDFSAFGQTNPSAKNNKGKDQIVTTAGQMPVRGAGGTSAEIPITLQAIALH